MGSVGDYTQCSQSSRSP